MKEKKSGWLVHGQLKTELKELFGLPPRRRVCCDAEVTCELEKRETWLSLSALYEMLMIYPHQGYSPTEILYILYKSERTASRGFSVETDE